jgi:YVTN family beta-propeller protein
MQEDLMRFLTGLSRRYQGRRSAQGTKQLGAGTRRFRRGTSASLRFRRRAAIINTILAVLMLVGNIPATAAGTVTSTIPVGLSPYGVAVTPDGSTAYVVNSVFGTVSVITVASGTVTSTIPVGLEPVGVAFSPDGSRAYVTNYVSNTVSVIIVASGTVTSTIPVGQDPYGVAFTPDGSTAYVTNAGSNTVSVINVVSAPPVFTADTPPTKTTTRAAYSYTFTATGNPAPTFYVSSGALPAGLSLDSSTGILSGTPTKAGKATFTVTATNGVSPDAVTPGITITVTKGKGR